MALDLLKNAENGHQSLRYLRGREVAGRIRYGLSTHFCRLLDRLGMTSVVERTCDLAAGRVVPSPTFGYPEAGGALHGGYEAERRFRFLGEDMSFRNGYDWNPHGKSLLWRFQLNYFDWAPRLAAEGRSEELSEQIDSWIVSNPAGREPAWHPYPTSLRIANWIRALVLLGQDHQCDRWIRSLSRQAAFLEGNLEYHLGANHLIENAFALLLAGLFFRGAAARRWQTKGLDLMRSELHEQVLPDGGHFERSVSYHFRVNRICREAIQLVRANQGSAPEWLYDVHERMSSFTDSVRHLDGNIPLFHDAQWIEDEDWDRFHRLKTGLR